MWSNSYWGRYWGDRYWNPGGELEIPPTQPAGVGGSDQVDDMDRWDNAEDVEPRSDD